MRLTRQPCEDVRSSCPATTCAHAMTPHFAHLSRHGFVLLRSGYIGTVPASLTPGRIHEPELHDNIASLTPHACFIAGRISARREPFAAYPAYTCVLGSIDQSRMRRYALSGRRIFVIPARRFSKCRASDCLPRSICTRLCTPYAGPAHERTAATVVPGRQHPVRRPTTTPSVSSTDPDSTSFRQKLRAHEWRLR